MAAPQFPLDPALAALIIVEYDGDRNANHCFHGHGHATFVNGQVYEGEFCDGRMHGRGRLEWPDGVMYEGDFEYNEISGQGRYLWPDESWYEGAVKGGKRHGHGFFQSSNKITTYEGEWMDGKQHGVGRMVYDEFNGIEYDGEWKAGVRDGHGTMKYGSGNVYEGRWENGVKCGQGTMHWFDKMEQYQGEWMDDKQHGYGVHVWKASEKRGNRYEGEFADGVRDGYGIFHYANGARYEGHWDANVKNGLGLFFFEDGTIYEGEFVHDRMVDLNDNRKQSSAEAIPTILLYVDDLLRGDERERAKGLKAAQNAVLRVNTDLRNVYRHYASCAGTTTPYASSENNVLMEMRELWRFAVECRLNASMGKLNRKLLVVRNAQNKAVKRLRIQRERKTRTNSRALDAIVTPREKWTDVHDPDRVVLFREFCEILVRIAWDNALEHGEVHMSVADAFTKLYDEYVHDHAATPMEPIEALEIQVHSTEMQTVFNKYHESLEKVYVKYVAKDVPVASSMMPENDMALSVRSFIKILQDFGVMKEISIRDALKAIRKASEVEMKECHGEVAELSPTPEPPAEDEPLDPFAMDADMIYPEFLENLTKIALVICPRNLPLPVITAQFIKSKFDDVLFPKQENRRRSTMSFHRV
ncbi:hypothetical protein H310_04282 [Aphanomyces invadans]|uniref:Radial spoke head 10 family protein n=1 Tax=Aphanomyces invadans TaxID=157072 RepID=A0A024UGD4_9STRA|nr:hypothetical protein H310_04282 [Aphanomyces invadans]ETW05344.1 hypothetical protein H310_04282 [Aphanomyces invadans]|eukprot:XP_008866782.1 hypothetical protein H310_04282 [Aphanomyces invadans]